MAKRNTTTETPEVEAPVEPTVHSTAELADLFGTDAKTLRRFLRRTLAADVLPGKGGRYRFSTEDIETLQAKFNATKSNKVTPMTFAEDTDAEDIDLDADA